MKDALDYVREKGPPIVIKASGLALGEGRVCVRHKCREAEEALKEIMINRAHKDAGDEVVTEEFLDGEEVSIHALCDGKEYLMFPPAQDRKRIGEGDTGKNTGGEWGDCSCFKDRRRNAKRDSHESNSANSFGA